MTSARDATGRSHLEKLEGSSLGLVSPPKAGLDFLGFPWIPSSETSVIKDLRANFEGKLLPAPFPADLQPRLFWRKRKKVKVRLPEAVDDHHSVASVFPQAFVGGLCEDPARANQTAGQCSSAQRVAALEELCRREIFASRAISSAGDDLT